MSAGAIVVFILFAGMVAALVVGTMAYVKSYGPASKTLQSNTLSSGTVPTTVISSAGAVGSPTMSLTSNDNAGIVNADISSTVTPGVTVTVTFAVPHTSTPRSVVITPMVSNTIVSNFRFTSVTVSQFVVTMDTVATSSGSVPLFSYVVL